MMKKAILRYGGYAALAELVLFVLTWLVIWVFNPSHAAQGNIGWVNLLCPLLFVYFDIRYYRDEVNYGSISFLTAIQIGLLITLLAALAYALVETVYVIWIDPGFYRKIYSYDLVEYKKTLSPAAYQIKAQQMEANLAMAKNPFYNFGIMVITIGALGIFATIISSLFLFKRKPVTV